MQSRGMGQLAKLKRAAEIFESIKPGSFELDAQHDQLWISGVPKKDLSAEQLHELEKMGLLFENDSWFMFT